VLNLRERHQEGRTYKDPEELIWDFSQGASVATLKLTIACMLRMPQETYVIAKHFPEEFQWRILTDDDQVFSYANFCCTVLGVALKLFSYAKLGCTVLYQGIVKLKSFV
jgi:hypothetical protein